MSRKFSTSRPAGQQTALFLEQLDGLVAELDKLPGLTDKSFLPVCANLQGLCGRLQDISGNARQAALLMSGEEALSVSAGLHQALGCMEEQLAAASLTTDRAVTGLGRIMVELEAIQRLVTDFKGRVGTLRMLKMITNIQGASLTKGAAGFQKVAADIGTLSLNVLTKTVAITRKRQELSDELHKAVTLVAALQASQKNLTGKIVTDIRHAIAVLLGMHEKCALVAQQLAGRSGAMSHELSEVVVAMQFHDITRQQFEHARTALFDLRGQVIRAERGPLPQELSFSPERVCALQTAQISNSTNELNNAVARIGKNLEGLAGEAATTSGGIHNLFGLAGSVEQSTIAEIETGLTAVLSAFAESRTTISHLARIMLTIMTAMGEVISFAEDIDFIGSEIKLIALNAIIKAAQAGKEGAAFGVIAAKVQEQSAEICQQATAITASIGAITALVDILQADLPAEQSDSAPEQTAAIAAGSDMAAAIATLRSLSAAVMGLLTETDIMATGLAGDIKTTLTRLDCPELREVLYRDLPDCLDRLKSAVMKVAQGRPDSGGRSSLEALQSQYTMRSERQVHELFAAHTFAGRSFQPVTPLGIAGADDEFGDNVELF